MPLNICDFCFLERMCVANIDLTLIIISYDFNMKCSGVKDSLYHMTFQAFGAIGYLRNLVILNCVLAKTIAYFFKKIYATFLAVITYVFLLNDAIANVPTYLLAHPLPF